MILIISNQSITLVSRNIAFFFRILPCQSNSFQQFCRIF